MSQATDRDVHETSHTLPPTKPGKSLRTGVSTPEGVLIIYDAPAAVSRNTRKAAYLAYWHDLESGDVYLYGGLLRSLSDVGRALLDLDRDLGVDPEPLANADDILNRGLLALPAAHDKNASWQPATLGTVLELSGLTPDVVRGISDRAADPIVVARALWCGLPAMSRFDPPPPKPGDSPGRILELGIQAISDAVALAADGQCDDNNVCTFDRCSRMGWCINTPQSEGSVCFSTGGGCSWGVCVDGNCTPVSVDNDYWPCPPDYDLCTDDYCYRKECIHPPGSGAPCVSDGDPCTDDVCRDGRCEHEPSSEAACASDGDPCTHDVCRSGSCKHEPSSGASCGGGETGDPCVSYVCDAGACVPTPKDCTSSDPCIANSYCDPCAGCVYEPMCDDGDACTEDSCDPVDLTCSFGRDVSEYCPSCQISMSFPAFIAINNDDDNLDGERDSAADWETVNPDEDDLVYVNVSTPGCSEAACGCPLNEWHFAGAYASTPAYTSAQRGERLEFDWPPPSGFWFEAAYGSSVRWIYSMAELEGTLCDQCSYPYHLCVQSAGCFEVALVKVSSLTWQKPDISSPGGACEVPTDSEHLSRCPNNGGMRIFPGKISPGDVYGARRKKVDLVATIDPPVADVPVYFRVFDVDDPFDQLHGVGAPPGDQIANVELIDNNADGPDNRGSDSAPGTYPPVLTDEHGMARLPITVSMQPGNNYRAAASCIQDAVQAPQMDQTVADSWNTKLDTSGQIVKNGGMTGYQVPAVWSPMLTVWRKLYVELDSMGPVTSNTATGTIVSVTTVPSAPQVQFEITDLDDDFEDDNHFHLGQASITGFGIFRTVASEKGFLFDDYVTIDNPGAVDFTGAEGVDYTLSDDDIGGVLGFPAPPVTFPELPDTGLMDVVYERAYLVIDRLTNPDVSQTNLAFSRNLLSQSSAYAVLDGSKDVDSSAEYWVVHVVSAYQGYSDRDGDRDSEEANPGLLYGLTKAGLFSRGASLVFLEACRDKFRVEPLIGDLERFNVAHEVGHQFELEHEDGAEDPPGSGTYLMKTSVNTVFPNNLWFSATSLNKIRSLSFPQDE